MRRGWLVLGLVACDRSVTEHVEGNDGALSLRLVNPTSCSSCDPWSGIDTVTIEVLRDDEVVATDSFSYPDEALVLPDLDGFGVVRVEVTGWRDGELRSGGRTPEVTLSPGLTREVPFVFLPVNVGLPLTDSMVAPRSGHTSYTLRDGRALLAGGWSPRRDNAYAGIELYDPGTGSFASSSWALAGAAGNLARFHFDDGEVLLLGGSDIVGGTPTAVTTVTGLHEELDASYPVASMSVARSNPCASRFASRSAVVFGGHQGTPTGELLVYDEGGRWKWSSFPLRDLDDTRVSGCAALADGRTFVQGVDAANTGLWPYTSESAPYLEPAECFESVTPVDAGEAAVYADGAAVVALDDGAAWIGGGIDTSTLTMASRAREFNPNALRYQEARAQPRRPRVDGPLVDWILPGWKAWGCGYLNGARTLPESSVELFDIVDGESGPVVGLDRERPGCHLTTLPDGSILVSGGFDADDDAAVSAAILVPWLE